MIVQTPRSLRLRIAAGVLCSLILSACSGGISGTGEGPIIVDPDDHLATDGMPEGSADSGGDNNPQIFPHTLLSTGLTDSLSVSARVNEADAVSGPADSVIADLNARIQSYATVAASVMQHLTDLETVLAGELSQCGNSGTCETLPANISASTTTDDTTVVFESILYTTGLPGYFDNRLNYKLENGDTFAVSWTNGFELISIYANTTNSITYAIETMLQPALIFRQLDKRDNRLTQASLSQANANETAIEADLTDWYAKASVTAESTVLYAISRNEETLLREAIIPNDDRILVESCTLANCVWQPAHNLSTTVFDNTADTTGNFNLNATSTLEVSFAQSPQRIVAAATANNGNPDEGTLLCGGVSVQDQLRVFCWVPLPLEAADPVYFEETVDSGSVSYRQLEVN